MYTSFYVIRLGRFVFNCFYVGYINLTGVNRISAISTALECLACALDLPMKTSVFEKTHVDNISAKCFSLETRIVNLHEKRCKLIQLNLKQIKSIKYNRERFPNMFIQLNYGTIIWSPNNNICCVGIKKEDALPNIERDIFLIDKI